MERFVREQIAALVDEISISSDYVVYVLECDRDLSPEQRLWAIEQFVEKSDEYSKPKRYKQYASTEPIKDEDREKIDVTPEWWTNCCRSDEIYYVGYTDNLGKRLASHILGTDNAALFTKIFEPDALLTVREYDTQQKAIKREEQLANTLNDFYKNIPLKRTQYDQLPIQGEQKQTKWDFLREVEEYSEKKESRVEHLVSRFNESESNNLIKHILEEQLESIEFVLNESSNHKNEYDKMYRSIRYKHLTMCRQVLEQSDKKKSDIDKENVKESLERISDFYKGAYLEYRGLIRRMRSDKITFVYQH